MGNYERNVSNRVYLDNHTYPNTRIDCGIFGYVETHEGNIGEVIWFTCPVCAREIKTRVLAPEPKDQS